MGNHPYTMYIRQNKFKRIPFAQKNNSFSLAGSVVVITSASSGIGEELCKRYVARGCRIVIGSRNFEKLQEVNNFSYLNT